MTTYALEFELLSDATFGRGDGVAGLIDAEVQHDAAGLPIVSGRALKGLLVSACAEILEVLPPTALSRWQAAAQRLFGARGETEKDLHGVVIGSATLAPDLAAAVHADVRRQNLSRTAVLESLTAIRRQTAVDAETGAPRDETLRAIRVVLRGLKFYAPVTFTVEPQPEERALLAACVLAWRRAGTGRNRGRGRLRARLIQIPLDPAGFVAGPGREVTSEWFAPFKQEMLA